jgi:hypothetical protein
MDEAVKSRADTNASVAIRVAVLSAALQTTIAAMKMAVASERRPT